MITFPCCKINLGLNVVSVRPNGYHNIETVFYPVPLCDALEVNLMSENYPSQYNCDLKVTGNAVDCNEQTNLVVRAYNIVAQHHKVPRIHIHLHKQIPSQAGLGGGSSDAAHMIRLLNETFQLKMSVEEMENYAVQLGADCPFFINSDVVFATGIGEELHFLHKKEEHNALSGYWLAIVKPNINISTAEAYAGVDAKYPAKNCRDIFQQPIDTWRDELVNDFEASVYPKHPRLKEIKQQLYDMGANYAQMSGSGSAHFGLFTQKPKELETAFPDEFTFICQL